MRAFQIACVMMLVLASAAFGQTAGDPGEGLRAVPGTTAGVTAIKWWGKSGRTYFVQSNPTLDSASWQYMPVVEAGTGAVCTWNLQTTAERMFVRLVYTDQSYTGTAGAADFDGDGLSNAVEVAANGPGTNPLVADTDGDGWGDRQEQLAGSNGNNALFNPARSNSSYIAFNRSLDVQMLNANEGYYMSRSKNNQGVWSQWNWNQSWFIPGSLPPYSQGGYRSSRPSITFHDPPYDQQQVTTGWTNTNMYYQQFAPPDLLGLMPSAYPAAQRTKFALDGSQSEYEDGGWGTQWFRYRLRMAQPLPFEHKESYIVVRHNYERITDEVLGPVWERDPTTTVSGLTLSIPAGATTGAWQFKTPETGIDNNLVVQQVAPVTFTLRASPGMHLNPKEENGAYDSIVSKIGNDANGNPIDSLAELPMGLGRGELPLAAYAAPVEVYATVPNLPGISWSWKRRIKAESWRIHAQRSDGINGAQTGTSFVWKLFSQFPRDRDDTPEPAEQDVTPSAAGRIYTGDSSGVNLPLEGNPLAVGDYLYYEKQFTYSLECTTPSGAFEIGQLKVAQIIGMRRTAQNGNASDFTPLFNVNYEGTVDVAPSQSEIWSLTGNPLPLQFP